MAPIPVTIITGFLGSGKTTLLNRLLSDPAMADTAVVINEFGEIAIDHLLVEASIENTLVLQSGCICCTVRGDLVDTLTELEAKRRRGDIPDFSRLLIETTGLAEPAPILLTLATDPAVAGLFRKRAVVTTVDAVNGAEQIEHFAEPARQVAVADLIIITKTDLAERGAIDELNRRLDRINPVARRVEVVAGAITPDQLFDLVPDDPAARPDEVRNWLRADAYEAGPTDAGADQISRHDPSIRAFSIALDRPIPDAALKAWLASITSLRGRDLLRMKGVVNVAGRSGPIVVQGVQHVLHKPVELPAWPDDDHRTRIVFITRGIPPAALSGSLTRIAEAEIARAG